MSDSRYADPVTIDHIIELRKEIAKLEMQLENTLAWVKKNVNQDLKDENKRLRGILQQIADIEHEDIPTPKTPNEGTTWTVLAMAVGLAEAALKEGE
jgi:hypothetical protein